MVAGSHGTDDHASVLDIALAAASMLYLVWVVFSYFLYFILSSF